jgi:hypothetical protein
MRPAEAQRYPSTDIEMQPGGLLEVQNRGRVVGIEPEESLALPACEPAGHDRRTDPVTLTDLPDEL